MGIDPVTHEPLQKPTNPPDGEANPDSSSLSDSSSIDKYCSTVNLIATNINGDDSLLITNSWLETFLEDSTWTMYNMKNGLEDDDSLEMDYWLDHLMMDDDLLRDKDIL